MKKSVFVILAAAALATACSPAAEQWTSMMPDAEFTNWRTVAAQPDPEASPEEIVISGNKVMLYGPADVNAPLPEFRNFVLRARVMTTPETSSSLWLHHGQDYGYEVTLGNVRLDSTTFKRGSLANVRNVYRNTAPDGEWFDLEVAVRGRQITVSIDGTPTVDYVEPAPERRYRTRPGMALLNVGTFVVDSYEGITRLRDMKIQALPDNAVGRTDAVDETAENFMQLVFGATPAAEQPAAE